jgi:hypothetical protein
LQSSFLTLVGENRFENAKINKMLKRTCCTAIWPSFFSNYFEQLLNDNLKITFCFERSTNAQEIIWNSFKDEILGTYLI